MLAARWSSKDGASYFFFGGGGGWSLGVHFVFIFCLGSVMEGHVALLSSELFTLFLFVPFLFLCCNTHFT